MARNYSNNATDKTLQASVTSAQPNITVDTTTGLPGTTPYTLVIDPDTPSAEAVTVTNVAGTTLEVTRGEDNTSAVEHSLNAVVRHAHTARDFAEPQNHIDAAYGVHGITGAVVGTTDAQTLTNKDIVAGNIDTVTLDVSGALTAGDAVVSGDVQAENLRSSVEITGVAATLTGLASLADVDVSGTLDVTGQLTAGSLLTASATATGSYSGTVKFTKIGKLVFAFGNILRSSGFSAAFENTGVVIPAGWLPATGETLAATPFFNDTITYRFKVDITGALQVQMSAAKSQNMTINAFWIAA